MKLPLHEEVERLAVRASLLTRVTHGLLITVNLLAMSTGAQESVTPQQSLASVQWFAEQLVVRMPRSFDGDTDWGKTKTVWSGIDWIRDDWKLTTRRRHREVRHGRWIRYGIALPEPATRAATVNLTGAEPIHDSEQSLQQWRIAGDVQSPATFRVRVERWNLGVQWFSVEISGKILVQLHFQATMGMTADYSEVPPAMQLDLEVSQAEVRLLRFEVERISKLGGDVAEELGDLAEETIGKVWLRKENDRLVERINRAIRSHRDDLRWSASDWLTQTARPPAERSEDLAPPAAP